MNLFELGATLGLDTTKFNDGLNDAEKKSNKSGGQIGGAINKGMGIVAGALAVGATGAIGFGSNFESSMSQVAATMGITADKSNKEFKVLSDAAKKAGSTTKYSASEASEALNYLALAGYDAGTSASMLPKVLNLASAGGLDLAYASDLVTDSMSALGLKTEEADGFIDQLAKTSQKSNTGVGQLGEAILTVGGTAKTLAGGTVELNTQLGILADNGIKGAEGGTALRNIILSLSSPTDKAAEAMKKMGLEVHDANGNMRSTNDIFTDLNGILSTMTQKKQTEVLSTIFNKVDLKSANALLAGSGDRFKELSGHISASDGAAQSMADTMSKNLAGSFKNFMSKVESLGIAVYEKFQVPLTNAVNKGIEVLGDIITKFENGDLDGIITGIGVAVGTLTGLFVALKAVQIGQAILTWIANFVKLASTQGIVTAAQWALNIAMTANPIGIIIVAIGALIGALVALFAFNEDFRNMVIGAWNAIKEAGVAVWEWLVKTFTETIPQAFSDMYVWFAELPSKIGEWFTQAWEKTKEWAVNMWNSAIETGTNFINSIVEFFQTLPERVGEFIGYTLTKIVVWSIEMWTKAREMASKFVENIITFFKELPGKVWTWITNTYNKVVTWGNNMWNKAKETGSKFINGIITFISELPGKLWKLLTDTITKVINFRNDMISKAKEVAREFTKWLIDGVKELPSKFFSIGSDIVKGVWNGITGMGKWLTDKVSGFFGGIVSGAKKALGIHSPSRVFRDVIGKQIPAGVEVGIEQGMPNLERTLDKEMFGLTQGYDFNANINPIGQNTPKDVKIELRIENFVNNTKADIEEITEQIAFSIEKKRYALGGI